MHLAGILAVLAAHAVAAPLDKRTNSSVKRETTQPRVQAYASYGPYYLSYGNYHSAEEAKTATAALTKRGYSCYTSYTPYPAVIEAEMAQSGIVQKRGYGTYSPYCVYGAAVEAQAMNMDNADMNNANMDNPNKDNANMAKRDVGKPMPKEMIMQGAENAGMTGKQDTSVEPGTDKSGKATKKPFYNLYSPY